MTEEKKAEMLQEVQQMIENPALAQFVGTLPDGRRAMQMECVAGLLFAALVSMDEAMEQVTEMIKKS